MLLRSRANMSENKWRNWLVLCSLVLMFFLLGDTGQVCADTPRACLFELVLDSEERDDQGLLTNINNQLANILVELERRKRIELDKKFEYSQNLLIASRIYSVEYVPEGFARYIIGGEVEDLSFNQDKRIEVSIDLYDLEYSNTEPLRSFEKIHIKDLDFVIPWIEGIAEDINDLICGFPVKQDVYAYCFTLEDNGVPTEAQKTLILKRLPIDLAVLLNAKLEIYNLNDHLKIKTFDPPATVNDKCSGHLEYKNDKYRYNYLITGKVTVGDEVKIDVLIETDNFDSRPNTIIDGFTFDNSEKSLDKLADHILNWWPKP